MMYDIKFERKAVYFMRLRNIPGADEVIEKSEYVIQDPASHKGRWKALFGNDNPIRMEIGMGKGKFLTTLAEQNPDVNYIGVEMYTSVLLRAVQKLEQQDRKQENIVFLRMDARDLEEAFAEGEIDRIYLNFSDPWPKDRHAKRRLPSEQFLGRYRRYLKQDGRIEFKTDNRALFDFAVEEAGKTGWIFEVLTYDLHHDEKLMQGNVMTEYEEKFSSIGNPIHKYIIYREKVPQEITVKS